MKLFLVLGFTSLFMAIGCGPKTPSVQDQISIAVKQTIAAIPTYTPYPLPSIPAVPTPAPLTGLFCEYQFCIGHPPDMSFFDVSAQRDPKSPSTISLGHLVAYNANQVIQFLWQDAAGSTDPQFMFDIILDPNVDTRNGDLDPLLIGDLNVIYVPINFSASPLLPNGGAAAWVCGGRAFAWKAYTVQPELAKNLLTEALSIFRCKQLK